MREIGLALGVVESRVSQVHASAVAHLRGALRDLAARGVFDRAQGRHGGTARGKAAKVELTAKPKNTQGHGRAGVAG